MEKPKISFKNCFKNPVIISLIVLITLSVAIPVIADSASGDKKQVAKKVADRWIKVGTAQYKRGMYKEAEKSLLRAKDYKTYLSDQELQKLNNLISKLRNAMQEGVRIEEHLKKAEQLIDQEEYIKAKAHLEKIKGSEYLTPENKTAVNNSIQLVRSKLDTKKKKVAEIYEQSVELYEMGQYEAARDGFVEVAQSGLLVAPKGKTPEDYLIKVDSKLANQAEQVSIQEKNKEKAVEDVFDEMAGELMQEKADKPNKPSQQPEEIRSPQPEPAFQSQQQQMSVPKAQDDGTYIESIERKRKIIKSHTNAVVNNAVSKAEKLIAEGKYDRAWNAVEEAQRTVNKNQYLLGEDVYKAYNQKLTNLYERVEEGKEQLQEKLQEKKRQEAIEAQEKYRRQMEIDRQNRIKELMQNAIKYQKQQRYEEALGQLESLLALDPLNDQTLILKRTLQDVISFRRQLEIHNRENEERAELLTDTDEAGIPYAEEITYPENWREITERRKPDESFGQDPADIRVNEQLDQIVSFPNFSPDMAFQDAIDAIRNSVDPPLKIIVLWRDLYDNADIEETTPIEMDSIEDIPVRTALENLLEAVSGGFAELDYVINQGVITIATVETLPSDLKVVVYDVSDLIGRPADFYQEPASGTQGGGGSQGGTVGGGFQDTGQQQQRGAQEMQQGASQRVTNLIQLIQETVRPPSWYERGGEGTINPYENKKLSIRQTPTVHKEIDELLKNLRKSHGHQVSIEARFLVVSENFMEDVGIDVDFRFERSSRWSGDFDPRGNIAVNQNHADTTNIASTTGIPGSLGNISDSLSTFLQYNDLLLNDLQVNFLIRATQAHRDSRSLTAPKLTVLSGESAALRLQQQFSYASEIEPEINEIGDQGAFTFTFDYDEVDVITGSTLNITPIITPDKKNVLLNIDAILTEFLGFEDFTFSLGSLQEDVNSVQTQTIRLPNVERSQVQTRVSVPDGGTILLGGQKLTVEEETEAGVPVLSKLPIVGRLFSNRSKIKDQRVLLILVKPTIILQEEQEQDALNALQD